jgi:hypothetical protein
MCCLDGKNMLAQTTSKHGTRHENNNFNHPGSSSGQARGAKGHEGFLNYFNHPGMREKYPSGSFGPELRRRAGDWGI